MTLETLLLFALTEFILCITPGPAVLVVAISMRRGLRAGWAASAGVVAGTAFYFVLSALGIGALIVASQTLFMVLKWAGAAYLVFLGIRMAWPAIQRLRGRGATEAGAPAPEPVAVAQAHKGLWPSFWKGFAGQLANPKTLIFFLALFPQFIAPDGNVALQFAIMALVSATIEMPTLMAYAFLSAASAQLLRERVAVWIEGVAGAILVFIGTALATSQTR